jgi:hypothetical protein
MIINLSGDRFGASELSVRKRQITNVCELISFTKIFHEGQTRIKGM